MESDGRDTVIERVMSYQRKFGEHRDCLFAVGQALKQVDWNANWCAVTKERYHLFCRAAASLRLSNGEVESGSDTPRIQNIARHVGDEG